MRNGVGAEPALRQVAARFGQRAIEDFFAGSARREFVINAGAAVEFASKAVIAGNDPNALWPSDELTSEELTIVAPDPLKPPISRVEWDVALARLLDRETISAKDAVKEAARLSTGASVDVSAADRLLVARNRAIHIGDVDDARANRHAADFITVFRSLATALHTRVLDLLGDLAAIADPRHMKTDRSPKVDAEARVVLARWRSQYGVVSSARRSGLAVLGETTRCPACQRTAHLTTQPPQSAPSVRVSSAEWLLPTRTLDCLHCGLELYGERQIEHVTAIARQQNASNC